MDPHRDIFKTLHPTLQSWLDTFEQDCQRYGGATYLYNSLVMLGLERPNNSSCVQDYCDCLEVIAQARQDILDSAEHVKLFPESKEHKHKYMCECSKTIDLYTAMHASHADFNRRVHFLLRNVCQRGMLAKIRAVCLRDLRHAAKNNGQGRIATPSYGRELATFLTYDPKGWW
jgi:hypothetical protein